MRTCHRPHVLKNHLPLELTSEVLVFLMLVFIQKFHCTSWNNHLKNRCITYLVHILVTCNHFGIIHLGYPEDVYPISNRPSVQDIDYAHQTRAETRHDLIVPATHLMITRSAFSYVGPVKWKQLPEQTRDAPSVATFKASYFIIFGFL